MARTLLITGRPGVGKTTVIQKVAAQLGQRAGGFYTQEMRQGGTRQGFEIATLDGQRAVLANINIRGPHRVGKYGVDLASLDEIAVPALRRALQECDILVVDEIGKMELLSPAFREALLEALNSDKRFLGTITLQPHPFADQIKRDLRVEVLTVSRSNRKQVLDQVTNWLRA